MNASNPDPYSQPYSMQPAPCGGANYGHPAMMQGHMHGGSHFGGGIGGGGMSGFSDRGGIVPFLDGDWKYRDKGCGYHSFAKNVSCIRCRASRSNAAVAAESGMTSFPGSSYGGAQSPFYPSWGPSGAHQTAQKLDVHGSNGLWWHEWIQWPWRQHSVPSWQLELQN